MIPRSRYLRSAGVAALVASVAIVGSGATAARLSSFRSAAKDSATAARVTLTSSASTACSVTGVLPDGTAHACAPFVTTYQNGSTVPAYVGVDIVIETQHATGGTMLYNPSDGANDLQVTVTAGSVTFTDPVTSTVCPTGAINGSSCYELDDELVSASSIPPGTAISIVTSVTLPTNTVAGTQSGAAQVLLTVHAAQATKTNVLACSATSPSVSPPAAGKPCTPTGQFRWS